MPPRTGTQAEATTPQATPNGTSEAEPTPAEWEERRTKLLAKVPPPDQRPANIYGKLAQILGLIPIVEKKGRNAFHGYNYAKESDLVEVVRPLLSAYGIFFWWTTKSEERRPQVHREGTTESLSVVWIVFRFIDENGVMTDVQKMPAYGDDPGDKGIYKALTGAVKYALMKTFLIATGDDPEGDQATDRRSAAAEASTRVEVQRGGRQAPQQLSPSQRARARREAAAAEASTAAGEEQAQTDEPPPPGAQPGPGGRQAEANAPAERQLSELLRSLGIRSSDDAIAVIGRIAGVEIPVNADDKAGSLAAFLTEYKTDRQRFGKLIYDLRQNGAVVFASIHNPDNVSPLRAAEKAVEEAETAPEKAAAADTMAAAEDDVEPPDDAYEAGESAV